MEGAEALDDVTGKPARKAVYDKVMPIPYAMKEDPSGEDIANALFEQGERKLGKAPRMSSNYKAH